MTKKNEKYQGYTNRETWLAHVWIDNDEDTHTHWRNRSLEILKSGECDRKHALARELEEWCKDQQPQLENGLYSDLLTTTVCRIEWPEIAHWLLLETEAELCHPMFPVEYARLEAIADGVLIDVTDLAKEVGFKISVAMTSAAWADCVTVPAGADCQDETGRLWDVLNVLWFEIKRTREAGSQSELRFTVSVVTGKGISEDIQLKSICGPGDHCEPVLTIMLPHED